jgi:hypothetical protein
MMIVLPETTKTATALNVHGENGVWKKPKSLGNNKDGKFNKIEYNEKRNYQRWHYKGSIWLTHFNKTDLMGAQTSNHCLGGMCFKSYTFFKLQTILLLRINSEGWDFSSVGDLKELRTVTLGEVKWCKDIPYKTSYGYETGIKYLAPVF